MRGRTARSAERFTITPFYARITPIYFTATPLSTIRNLNPKLSHLVLCQFFQNSSFLKIEFALLFVETILTSKAQQPAQHAYCSIVPICYSKQCRIGIACVCA